MSSALAARRASSPAVALACALASCVVDAPPRARLVPAAPRVECGTLEPRLLATCHDFESEAGHEERIVDALPLGEGAALVAAVQPGACNSVEDPGRRLRAEVRAACERAEAEPPARLVQSVSLEATVERVCSRHAQSTARASPRWQGTLVVPAGRAYALLVSSESSLDAAALCHVRVGDGAAAPIGPGVRSLVTVQVTGSTTLSLDCGVSQNGFADLTCYQTPENAARPPPVSTSRVVLTLTVQEEP